MSRLLLKMNESTQGSSARPSGLDGPAATPAIRVEGLIHRYGGTRRDRRPGRLEHRALDGVSFEVAAGQVFGVLGPNGSGKSTLFKILATLLHATEGRAAIFGFDVADDPQEVRRRIGVLFQTPSLDLKLTAAENLVHQGHLYGMYGTVLRQRIEELLELLGLAARRDDLAERFSGGMQRRLELAKAMLHEPQILLLDEPDSGLDPGARRDLWSCLDEVTAQGKVTVALTTHLMELAERCDMLAILNHGTVAALDSPDRLTRTVGGRIITVAPATGQDPQQLLETILSRFGPWPEGLEPILIERRVRLRHDDGPALVGELDRRLPGKISSITVGRPTLEDVFLHLTGHTLWEGQ
jgi:ABC-2 type transport system ATP-binding protein